MPPFTETPVSAPPGITAFPSSDAESTAPRSHRRQAVPLSAGVFSPFFRTEMLKKARFGNLLSAEELPVCYRSSLKPLTLGMRRRFGRTNWQNRQGKAVGLEAIAGPHSGLIS
jgi:hypothetical protein